VKTAVSLPSVSESVTAWIVIAALAAPAGMTSSTGMSPLGVRR
jgi:hypothetical protein